MGDAHADDTARAEFEERIRDRARESAAGTAHTLAEAFKRITP